MCVVVADPPHQPGVQGQRLLQRLDAKSNVHGVGQAPGQHGQMSMAQTERCVPINRPFETRYLWGE